MRFGVVVFPGTWSDRDCGWLIDLKALSNRDLRVGDLVHGSIARYFRNAQKDFLMSVSYTHLTLPTKA